MVGLGRLRGERKTKNDRREKQRHWQSPGNGEGMPQRPMFSEYERVERAKGIEPSS